MTAIAFILIVKIAVTAVLTAAPFLLTPEPQLAAMLRTTGDGARVIFRLYGVAVLALLVGYGSGFWTIAEGRFPFGVAAMGVVSNGGAAAALLITGGWRRARLVTAFVAGIAVVLLLAAAFSRQALAPLW
ncbi:hypothetical protein [Bradyrhizobium sp. 2TAF24]|uniref:hypothetical protein n=1 Tax=Bradyrhizobium sp. 2TAF24 TaxID=3233011 RepID=UPI003F91EB45